MSYQPKLMAIEKKPVSDSCSPSPTREGFVPNPREFIHDRRIPYRALHSFWVQVYPNGGGYHTYMFQAHTCEPTDDGGIAFTGLEVNNLFLGYDEGSIESGDYVPMWGYELSDVPVSGTYWPEKKLLSIVIEREQKD